MSYFSDQYQNIFYPIATETSTGLRNAQLGAIYAISSYFTLYDKKPALVVMPTGSGKTSVLILTAFTQRANKVLVITPSILVRGQIYDEFSNLTTLKKLDVLYKNIKGPSTIELKSYLSSKEDWIQISNYNVIISTPNIIYKAFKGHFKPGTEFFDLVLVDEAHHSSSLSWNTIINYFSNSKKVFFTATPFRRDKKEIEGELIYSYPLSKAFEDKIFSDLYFFPIQEQMGIKKDIVLAKEAEKIFLEDRESGYDHYLFVRTSSIPSAKELYKIYGENTKLNLKIVDSTKTYSSIIKTIEQLKNKKLDGVICVNMLGEGFDFPNLKIAAIHSPHKSLAATLQFIGRFVRTNTSNIGQAKFLAIVNEELEVENTTLYAKDIIWREKIIDMSEGRIEREGEVKKVLNTYNELITEEEDYEELSIYNVNPYFHVKIYKIIDFNYPEIIDIPGQEIVNTYISKELNSIIVITREITRPRWFASDQLTNIDHNLFIIYFDEQTNLLFINSSIKTIEFYDFISKQFTKNKLERIQQSQIHKVLADITETDFFSIGLVNRFGGSGETYRIMTGPSTQNSVHKSDGRLYSSGHLFGRGKSNGENTTIGYSSASKVWSNRYDQIPLFIKWCKQIATKLVSNKIVKTNSALDDLPQGINITEFPGEIYFATWSQGSFSDPPVIKLFEDSEAIYEEQLLDFEIYIIKEKNFNNERVKIDLKYDDIIIPLEYNFNDLFKIRDEFEFQIQIFNNIDSFDIVSYLKEYPLDFYLVNNNAMIHEHLLYSPPTQENLHFDREQIISFNWEKYSTNIQKEFDGDTSIHETLKKYFIAADYDYIIYDHGTREIADFITIRDNNEIKIELYHVKAAKSKTVKSNRVDEVYEVSQQAIKSLKWIYNIATLRNKLKSRINNNRDKIIKGSYDEMMELLSLSKRLDYELFIVQPGISKSKLTSKIAELLAACDYYIRIGGNKKLTIIGSE